jgi:hypothetical protein
MSPSRSMVKAMIVGVAMLLRPDEEDVDGSNVL